MLRLYVERINARLDFPKHEPSSCFRWNLLLATSQFSNSLNKVACSCEIIFLISENQFYPCVISGKVCPIGLRAFLPLI